MLKTQRAGEHLHKKFNLELFVVDLVFVVVVVVVFVAIVVVI